MEALKLLGISGPMILLQMIPFLAAVIGLYFIIFRPTLALLADRERNIDGFKKEASRLQDDAATKLAALEAQLQEARRKAADERARLRAEAQHAEQEILDAARQRADVLLGEARKKLAAEQEIARSGLRGAAQDLSRRIASSVLGRQVGGGAA